MVLIIYFYSTVPFQYDSIKTYARMNIGRLFESNVFRGKKNGIIHLKEGLLRMNTTYPNINSGIKYHCTFEVN